MAFELKRTFFAIKILAAGLSGMESYALTSRETKILDNARVLEEEEGRATQRCWLLGLLFDV